MSSGRISILAVLLHGRGDYLFMEEVIHNDGRLIERPLHRIIIPEVDKAFLFCEFPHPHVELIPVALIASFVDILIEREEVRIF